MLLCARAFQLPSRRTIYSKGSHFGYYSSIMAPRATAASKKQDASSDRPIDESPMVVAVVEDASAAPRKSTRKRAAKTDPLDPISKVAKAPNAASTRASKVKPRPEDPKATTSNNTPAALKESDATKTTKTPGHQVLTDRDEIPKLWDEQKAEANGSYSECRASSGG